MIIICEFVIGIVIIVCDIWMDSMIIGKDSGG